MKTQQEIDREAEAVLGNSMGVAHWTSHQCTEAVRYLSAAGLLVSPTLLECAEACVESSGSDALARWIENTSLRHTGAPPLVARCRAAGRAHAATLAKPARYEVAGGQCVVEAGKGGMVAYFSGPDAERHAREHAARLNADAERG